MCPSRRFKKTIMLDTVSASRVRRREIRTTDIDRLTDLLTRGFRGPRRYDWVCTFNRLSEHPTPLGFPKYGYLLECEDRLVGVILQIYSAISHNGGMSIRCNDSSWYVEPAFRTYASLLISHGHKNEQVTYFNVTPGSHTWSNLEARGFVRYSSGSFAVFPLLSSGSNVARVIQVTASECREKDLGPAENELLVAHARYGCISVTCSLGNRTYPFVFAPRKKYGIIPYVDLIYCRDLADFGRLAKPLGRFLARRGFFPVIVDANDKIRDLVGVYFPQRRPKYFKGPEQPRLGDLAYSEVAIFPLFEHRSPLERLRANLLKLRALLLGCSTERTQIFNMSVRSEDHPKGEAVPRRSTKY